MHTYMLPSPGHECRCPPVPPVLAAYHSARNNARHPSHLVNLPNRGTPPDGGFGPAVVC